MESSKINHHLSESGQELLTNILISNLYDDNGRWVGGKMNHESVNHKQDIDIKGKKIRDAQDKSNVHKIGVKIYKTEKRLVGLSLTLLMYIILVIPILICLRIHDLDEFSIIPIMILLLIIIPSIKWMSDNDTKLYKTLNESSEGKLDHIDVAGYGLIFFTLIDFGIMGSNPYTINLICVLCVIAVMSLLRVYQHMNSLKNFRRLYNIKIAADTSSVDNDLIEIFKKEL